MSAPAINLANPPTPGASGTPGVAGAVQGVRAVKAQGPLAAFEAMLAELFGAQGVSDGAAAGAGPFLLNKVAPKTAAGASAAAGDGKGKAAGEPKGPSADAATATAAPDATLALMVTASPAALAVGPTPAKAGDAPAANGAAADKTAAALSQLAGTKAGGDANAAKMTKATLAAAGAAGAPQTAVKPDATAQAKADTPAQPAPATTAIAKTPDVSAAAVPASAVAATPPPVPGEEVKPAPVTAAAGAKDKPQTQKSARIEGARVDAAPGPNAPAKLADALQAVSDNPAKGGSKDRDPNAPGPDAKSKAADPSAPPAGLDTASTTTPAALVHAAAVAVRGAPQTVANLAAQIAKKLDGRSTRFDVQLDPAGLGKVDVRVEIGSSGKMTAAMSFDNPQAAAELRSRAGELQRALEQAGFDLSGGLSFDVAGERGQGGGAQGQNSDSGAAFRGRAFQAVAETADVAPPVSQLNLRRTAISGVDIRI